MSNERHILLFSLTIHMGLHFRTRPLRWVTGVFPPSSEYWFPRSPIQPQCTESELRSQKLIPCSPIHSNERDRRSDNQRLESEGCVASQRPWAKSFALGLQLSTHKAGTSGAWLEDSRPKTPAGGSREAWVPHEGTHSCGSSLSSPCGASSPAWPLLKISQEDLVI